MKNNIFKLLIVRFLVIMGGLIVIASDIIVKQGDLYIESLFASNNMRIGTNSPSKLLEIKESYGTSFNPGVSLVGIELTNTATIALPSRQVDIGFRGSNTGLQGRYAAITGVVTGSSASGQIGSIVFSTKSNVGDSNLAERMRITNIGNVGIGTISPGAMLTIYNDVGASIRVGNTFQAGFEYSRGSGDLYLGGDGSQAGNFYIKDSTGTTKIRLNSDTDSYIYGVLKLPSIGSGASGKDYVCIDLNGVLSRSNTACA